MDKKKWIIILLIVTALALAACERSISGPSVTVTQTADQIEGVYNFPATLTAQVSGGASLTQPADGVVTVTPTAPALLATATPTEKPTLAPTEEMTVPDTYTLHKGEFVYCIARRFNVDVGALLSANGLTQNSVVYAGLKLTIPQSAGSFNGQRALKDHPTEYTVGAGDTIYSIACQFGDVWPEAIAQVNGFDIDDPLPVGETIQIP